MQPGGPARASRQATVRVAAAFAGPLLPAVLRAVGAVRPHVFAQVVGAHEAFVANRALEALLARVRAQVPLELVRAREALPAEEPVADEGPLPGVPAQVSLQVRRLAVHFTATRDVTAVQAPPTRARAPLAKSLRLLAVGAVARGSARVAAGGRAGRRCHGNDRASRRRRRPRRRRLRVGARGRRSKSVEQVLRGGEQVLGGTGAERGAIVGGVAAQRRR